jgi:transposase-like protein
VDKLPKSLLSAVRYFSDRTICNDYMRTIKWPDGEVRCPHCGGTRIGEIKTRAMFRCKDCRKQFSYKVGTIFEDSPLGLDNWFVGVWAIANCKNGISSHELARALGVTQKTAWFMLHRIREAMRSGEFRKLRGEVESDETFVGGEAANMHKGRRARVIQGRGAVGKRIVHGMLERAGAVRAHVVQSTEAAQLLPRLQSNVEPSSAIYTDAHKAYEGLWWGFIHQAVDHAKEYVRGRVHTNGLENFWSLFKRTLKGTYVSVAPFHLQRYVQEQEFRFNNRKTGDGERFAALMGGVAGRRLTYRQLCELDGCGFMGLA